MAVKAIRSRAVPISITATLATADDLDGTTDNTQAFDVTGASRLIIAQWNVGTLGTAGIDVIEISHDAGANWAAVTDLVPGTANDFTGTVAASGALNAAGVEPTTVAVWRCGPYDGPTAVRCGRKTTDTTGTTWITGAPLVTVQAVGGSHAGGALTALALS
jgi:hypothetical protein